MTQHNTQKTWTRWHLPALVMATTCNTFAGTGYFSSLLPWAGVAFLLYFVRTAPVRAALWMGWASLFTAALLNGYDKIPFPPPVLLIICLIGSGLTMVTCLLDRFVWRTVSGFVATLFFPAISVANEYLNSFSGSGTWSSIANAQFEHRYLIQIVSMTGIWGVSFLVYWFGSVLTWVAVRSFQWALVRKGVYCFSSVLAVVMLFGWVRTHISKVTSTNVVRVAGVSVDNLPFLEAAYEDYSGRQIHLSNNMAQNDPVLQEAQKGLAGFIEGGEHYSRAAQALAGIQDSLFSRSAVAVSKGAKIVLWPEANAMALKNHEPELVKRGREFAAAHHVYLLMPVGIIRPGKLLPGTRWLENKAIFIGPDGRVLNTYFKSIPVPGAEPAVVGPGKIPVISTAYGKVAIAICYDADFPKLIQQAGKQKANLLLVPSGDWKAIAPLHSYMAVFRGIENGCSVVRQVSRGLSVAALPDGRLAATSDYFTTATNIFVADISVARRFALYQYVGDSFAVICLAAAIAGMICCFVLRRRMKGKHAGTMHYKRLPAEAS